MNGIFDLFSDEELVESVRAGSEEAFTVLLARFDRFISFYIRKNLIKGIPYDDIKQECNIAIYKACMSYNINKNVKFVTYLSAVLSSTLCNMIRSKQKECNYVSLSLCKREEYINKEHYYVANEEAEEIITEPYTDEYVTLCEIISDVYSIEDNFLSQTEKHCIIYTAIGYNISEIAFKLHSQEKTVYNALYRARIKLRKKYS